MKKTNRPGVSGLLPHRKISEAFLDYASPLLVLMPPDAQATEIERILRIAFVVWNAMVLDQVAGGDEYIAKAKACMSGNAHGTAAGGSH